MFFINLPLLGRGRGEAFVKKKGRRVATDNIRRRTNPQQPFFNEQLTMNNEQCFS
jgi:hypothetical protein